MAEVKYTISRTDIENTPKMFIYSKLDLYHTVRIDEDGKETFNGDVSEYMVRNGVDGIPSFEVSKWRDAVESFIYDHNDKVNTGEGFNIKFNITSVDSRCAYAYEETVNGKVVKSGVGWGLDFDTQVETDAWMDAVIEYNKANGIKMPSDKIMEKLNKLKESIKSLDNELPEYQGFEMPTISVALPSLNSDPCEFVSKLKEASENVVATIGGMPAPKDIINHNIKIIKENIYTATARTYDTQTKVLETPVNNTGKEFTDKVKSKFLELGKNKKIAGFSILGGEPLQQGKDMLDLVKEIKETYPDKTIWMWTGCIYEELTPEQLDIVKYVDVLIDGRFDMEHRTPRSRYKGSFNQRVIDVAKTLKANKCVLHELNYS